MRQRQRQGLSSCSALSTLPDPMDCDPPGGSDGKASDYNTGDPSSIPGSGRSSEEENGNSLWYSCQENSMDRGAW